MIWLIFTLVFIFYGISVSWKNSGTKFFIIWFVLAALSLGMYGMQRFSLWRYVPKIWIYILIAGISITTFIIASLFLCVFSAYFSKGVKEAEYIIILGAQWKKTGPSKALKYRLDKGFEYLQNNPNTKCIVSGGQGYNEPCTEADGMALYLINRGIDETRIVREDSSTSTIENISFSKKYLSSMDASICIVSNAFHIYRAVAIAKKQCLKNAYGLSARSDLWYLPNNAFREVFGIIKDFLYKNLDF